MFGHEKPAPWYLVELVTTVTTGPGAEEVVDYEPVGNFLTEEEAREAARQALAGESPNENRFAAIMVPQGRRRLKVLGTVEHPDLT
jgi:hypothetical protein